jgi:hypothetical protein
MTEKKQGGKPVKFFAQATAIFYLVRRDTTDSICYTICVYKIYTYADRNLQGQPGSIREHRYCNRADV